MFDAENLENFLELIFINDKHCQEDMKTKTINKNSFNRYFGRFKGSLF